MLVYVVRSTRYDYFVNMNFVYSFVFFEGLIFYIYSFFGYVKSFYFSCISYSLGFDKYSYLFISLSRLICLMMIYSMLMYSFSGFSYFLFYVIFSFFSL